MRDLDSRRNTSENLLVNIAGRAEERVAPRCRHFGQCGGCQLQHLPYDRQVKAKAAMLEQTLAAVGVRSETFSTHAADPWAYRNRVRLRVEHGAMGYNRRASNEFLKISECHIVSPLIWRVINALRDSLPAERDWPPGTDGIEITANGDDSAVQLSFHLRTTVTHVDRDAPHVFRVCCEGLRVLVPELAGAGLSVAAAPDAALRRRLQESQHVEIARWEDAGLTYIAEQRTYRVTRNSFFQVNRFLLDEMVRSVVADHRGGLAWDLFAGAGLFSVPLAERFDRVIAVEIAEPAASDLARHLQAAGGKHHAVRSTVADFLRKSPLARGRTPDLIVLDPPRAGINAVTTSALISTGAQTMAYVSCDAGTFARDARALIQSGYTLASLQFFDLFPQTFHTETVAVFRR